jgi:PII-like signaling protein
VNHDCLKLTIYFGERDRTHGGFLAEIYARHELQTSLVMRGVQGFGLEHRLHTDRLLTLSEDLPLVSVAVDARSRIESALAEVEALRFDGLVTLERARMLAGEAPQPGRSSTRRRTRSWPCTSGATSAPAADRHMRPWSTCCVVAGSPAPPCCSGSTGRRAASVNGHASSAPTLTSR